MWLGQRDFREDGVSLHKSKVDRVMGVKKPVFKKQYHATRLNSSYLFHSISMMMVGVDNCNHSERLSLEKEKVFGHLF